MSADVGVHVHATRAPRKVPRKPEPKATVREAYHGEWGGYIVMAPVVLLWVIAMWRILRSDR